MPSMRIGHFLIDPPVVLAPMAGVTDKPFRQLCKRLGAGLAVSEMTTADPRLWHTTKSQRRADHSGGHAAPAPAAAIKPAVATVPADDDWETF